MSPKKKSSSNKKSNNPKAPSGHRLGQEIIGVVLLSVTVLLLAANFTYSPDDILSVAGGNVQNAMGLAGAYVAHGLFTAFGAASFLVPFITLLFSLSFIIQRPFIIRRPVHFGVKEFLGLCLFLLFTCSFLDLYYSQSKAVLGVTLKLPGGWLGDSFNSGALKPLLGAGWGAYLVSVTGMVATFMVLTRFSFVKFFSGVGSILAWIFDKIISFVSWIFKGIMSVLDRIGHSIAECIEDGRESKRERDRDREKLAAKTPVPKKEKKSEKKVFSQQEIKPVKEKVISPPVSPPPEPEITRVEEKSTPPPVREHFSPSPSGGNFSLPPVSLLEDVVRIESEGRDEELRENSRVLMDKLNDFGVQGRIVKVCPGPVITRYEFEPAPGVKINKIANLADDMALAMSALSVRIVAPIPGRSVVGIEIPNNRRETIYLKEIMDCSGYRKAQKRSKLTLVLGKDIAGVPVFTDLAKMPHLLVAGSTGSGKSVSLNGIILSLLFNATPDELKIIMIDPKMLELGIYNGIPHQLIPTVTDPQKAATALGWAIEEMEDRYCLLADRGVRNIDQYNRLMEKKQAEYTEDEMGEDHHKKLPFIVLIVDEFADLMMTSSKSKEVEGYITRLAQMARAVGIHLIIATQRPSVDVITGLIKANFPSRISFRVASRVDSRTILDCMGSEKLLGMGDMLFLAPGCSHLERLHGPLVTEAEIRRIVKFLADQSRPEYDYSIIGSSFNKKDIVGIGSQGEGLENFDEVYDEAVEFVVQKGQASTSMIQRRFKIGYNRAANVIEVMEREGVVGPADGSRPRAVLVPAPD